jgi:calpain
LGVDKEINKSGYIIMPSTYQSKIHGTFILSVKSDQPFELTPMK